MRADVDGFFSKDDQNVLERVMVMGLGTKNRRPHAWVWIILQGRVLFSPSVT